jgi:hypothetical protein
MNYFEEPVIPRVGPQNDAMVTSQAVIYSATDRGQVKDQVNEVNRRAIKEIFDQKNVSPKVENPATPITAQQIVTGIDTAQNQTYLLDLFSKFFKPQAKKSKLKEQLDVKESKKGKEEEEKAVAAAPQPPTGSMEEVEVHPETAALAKELNLDLEEIAKKFKLSPEELHALIFRIRELHLKRLLCQNYSEFEQLSNEILHYTIMAAKPGAQSWLTEQMNRLTQDTAEYKIKLLQSLQALDYDYQRETSLKWLTRVSQQLKEKHQ